MPELGIKILPVTPFAQNCSLIWDKTTMRGALVDAGGDIERLQQAVEAEGVTLEKLLVTHGHLDHVGAVGELAKKLELPIEGPHQDDQFWIDMLPAQAQQMGFPASQSFTPNRWLTDGEQVSVGNIVFDVLHCPGHTPGHVVFYQAELNLALVGDVIFQGSIGRSDFPRGNHEELVRSIREKLFPLGDQVQFVPGHGPLSTFGQERKTNPFVSDSQFG